MTYQLLLTRCRLIVLPKHQYVFKFLQCQNIVAFPLFSQYLTPDLIELGRDVQILTLGTISRN